MQLVRRRGMQRRVLQPRPRAGDRRAQVVRDGVRHLAHAVHQPADAVEHVVDRLGKLVELVAAAGDAHAAAEIAGGDRGGGGRDIGQRAAEQAAHDEGAGQRHHRDHDQPPQQRVGQQLRAA